MSTQTFARNGGDNYSCEAENLYLFSLLTFAGIIFYGVINIFTFVIEI
jgi:hypothetical protein